MQLLFEQLPLSLELLRSLDVSGLSYLDSVTRIVHHLPVPTSETTVLLQV